MRAGVTIILVFGLIFPLGGCQTDQERMAEFKARNDALDDQTCKGYGAKPGTDIYIQCRMQRQQSREMADSAVTAAPVVVNNAGVPTPSYPTLQPLPQQTRCRSTNLGMGVVNTVCN